MIGVSVTFWRCALPDDSSSAVFVQRSLVARLCAAQASVAEAGRDLVMLTAVGESDLTPTSLAQLRSADSQLRGLLAALAPDSGVVEVDWDVYLSRLGWTPAQEAAEAGMSMRDRVRAVLDVWKQKYFSPNEVYAVLRKDSSVGIADPRRLRKAVQNTVAAMARSGEVRRADRGRYITPGRENDPDPDEEFLVDADKEDQKSGTFLDAGSTWLAAGGPPDETESELGPSASRSRSHSAKPAA